MNTRHSIDPRNANIACDANALDYTGGVADLLVDRFRILLSEGRLRLVVAAGVRDEVQNPRTPTSIQEAIVPQIFNLRPRLTLSQQDSRFKVRVILQGNAAPGRHAADALHISEASEAGCAYFITNDKRILRKRDELASVLPATLAIADLNEFFEIVDAFQSGGL
ncbi:hypothetical protein [Hyphomicrobium sulfonivorans]|uniref:hypothetical protein n=1 Tax=Hyphomicrobium sulfonivorans TaxID=121290 RepID=UPI0015703606|nr:hypothetical protein [Hyphomicrobium sulfonivorans]MBI1649993.1 hypothetical protein [Hyphomicrobium sulfonivorans]NSL72911.1 hypothetical protein [Hyphomicrobium sulfonivorans]